MIGRAFVVALVGLAACDGCKGASGEGESPKATAEDVAAAKAAVESIESARKAALASAKTTVVGRNDLGRCPVDVGHFGPASAKDITGSKTAWGGYDVKRWSESRGNDLLANLADELCAIERLGIAYADEVGVKPGPRGFELASLLRDTDPRKWQVDGLLKTEDAFDFELVIDDEIAPKLVSADAFAPGMIRARFYVWDNAKKAIVCAARVTAESSDSLHAMGTDQAQVDLQMESGLLSDLREQALDKVKGELFVAGPPRWATEGDGGADGGRGDAAEAGTKR